MTNQEIARIFREVAAYLEMQDLPRGKAGVRFESRAYERAADAIGSLEQEVGDIYKKSGLRGLDEISGVGRGIALHIEEMLKTGAFKKYQQLQKKTPVQLSELMRVEGLGPKKIQTLYRELGIKTLADLEKSAKAGKVRELAGFGKKTEENILHGISFVRQNSGRMLLGDALPVARAIIEELKKLKDVEKVSEAGSLRRRQETIGDIDILVASKNPKPVLAHFVGQKNVEKVWGKGSTKASVHVKEGFDIDLRVLAPESWGAGMQYFTGSKAHNVAMRQIAIKKNLKLNEYGVFRGKKNIASKTEEEVYGAIGLPYIEPEMREDTLPVAASGHVGWGKRAPKIIPYGALRGDLQVQTSSTDGAHSIRAMAEAARDAGLSYIAITDHTKSLAMTGGLDEKGLLRQKEKIDALNEEIEDITLLAGAEVNILADGSLDIADEVLAQLDVVGISVHSRFRMSRKEMTDRIVRAMQNPNAHILFHPTGRLINKREPYAVDMERIIDAAEKTRTILEINAQPQRLDLSDEYIRMAREKNVKFAISSDAHHKGHFAYLEYGIAQARRGWVEAGQVINTYPKERMLGMLKK